MRKVRAQDSLLGMHFFRWTSRPVLTRAALVFLGLVPVVLMVSAVLRSWLPLPYWDDWHTPGATLAAWANGDLTWQHLFSQHNESRKFFPRLLYLALAQFGGWDMRKEMTITLLVVGAIAFLFSRLMRQLPGATTHTALVAWVIAAFLCFSPVQIENFIAGIQLETFFLGLAVLGFAAINLSHLSLTQKAACNGLLALICTYTAAHGMLLWLLGIPLPARGEKVPTRRKLSLYGGYIIAAGLSIGAYFIDYTKPSYHPAFFAGNAGAFGLAHYLILWVGSYLKFSLLHPFAGGAVAIVLFAAALLGSLWVAWRQANWRPFYPAFLIATYACATAAITVAGRIGFGVDQALDGRYRTYSLFFFLALAALLFALHQVRFIHADARPRRLFLTGCIVIALMGLGSWIGCYRDGLSHQRTLVARNRVFLRALEWSEVIPDNPVLRYVLPYPPSLLERIRLLRQHRVLRFPFVSPNLADAVRETPRPVDGQSFGQLESCAFGPDRNLRLTGRAKLPNRSQPPDCIVIGVVAAAGSYKPVSILETTRPRDGGRARGPRDFRLLFEGAISAENFPPGDIAIAAWAVDLQTEKLYPLAGVTFIPASHR